MSDKIEAEILDALGEEVDAAVDTPLVVIEGTKGDPGADGITPTIGSNGNWYLGTTDTGKPSRGAAGKKGNPGADGITPTIGANGNWYLGETDTNKPSRGAKGDKGDPGAPGKDGAGIDITGARIGQIAKITAVDASGVPTAWAPADMPAGAPPVTAADNGKFLRVVNGAWAAAEISSANGGSF